jgi:hypothetical protein
LKNRNYSTQLSEDKFRNENIELLLDTAAYPHYVNDKRLLVNVLLESNEYNTINDNFETYYSGNLIILDKDRTTLNTQFRHYLISGG